MLQLFDMQFHPSDDSTKLGKRLCQGEFFLKNPVTLNEKAELRKIFCGTGYPYAQ